MLTAEVIQQGDTGYVDSEYLQPLFKTIGDMADDYAELNELLSISNAKLERIKHHAVIGRVIKFWKLVVNRNFNV